MDVFRSPEKRAGRAVVQQDLRAQQAQREARVALKRHSRYRAQLLKLVRAGSIDEARLLAYQVTSADQEAALAGQTSRQQGRVRSLLHRTTGQAESQRNLGTVFEMLEDMGGSAEDHEDLRRGLQSLEASAHFQSVMDETMEEGLEEIHEAGDGSAAGDGEAERLLQEVIAEVHGAALEAAPAAPPVVTRPRGGGRGGRGGGRPGVRSRNPVVQ